MTHANKIKTQPIKGKKNLSAMTPQQTFPASAASEWPRSSCVWQIMRFEGPTPWYPWGSYLSIYACVCTYIYLYVYLADGQVYIILNEEDVKRGEALGRGWAGDWYMQLWKEVEQFALPSTSAIVSGAGFKIVW